jgi:hypothetical protein
MALPSREQTFAFADFRELLEKLDREIDRYREVMGRDDMLEPDALMKLVDQLKDSAFNASVTAWQLPPVRRFATLEPSERREGGSRVRLPADHIRFAAAVQFCCLITSREGALDRFQISRIGSIDQPTRRRQSGAPL